MSFTLGEANKPHNVNAAFDMTANTELTLTYTLPSGLIVIKNSTDGVVLGTVLYTDPDTGAVFQPNEYAIYPIEAGFLAEAGTDWSVYLTYDDNTTSPPTAWVGKCALFTVEDPTSCS
jgi:hypothetical protein